MSPRVARWSSVLAYAAALGAVSGCAGCAHASRADEPAAIELPAAPERWATETEAGAPNEEWWRASADSDLEAHIARALVHNYDLAAASARLDAAAALARIAGAESYPFLGAGADASRRRENFLGIPLPGSSSGVVSRTFNSFGVHLDTTWEIDLWGRIRAQRAAAQADVKAVAADRRGARLSLAAQTARVYLAVVEAKQQVALAERTAASFEETLGQVRARYERGVRPSLDLRLAASNVAGVKALFDDERERLSRALRQLELLTGSYPEGSAATTDTLPAVPGPIPAGLPSDLLERRPDLIAAERRLAAAEERTTAARAALFPRIGLTGSTGTASEELEDLVDGDFFVWNVAAGLTQPIFEGGRLRAEVDLAEARADEERAAYAGALLAAFTEVESALAADGALASREGHLTVAASEALAAQELSKERYRGGLTDFVTVLEAERRALDLERQRLRVRRLRWDNRVDLHLALGGGFRDAEKTPEP